MLVWHQMQDGRGTLYEAQVGAVFSLRVRVSEPVVGDAFGVSWAAAGAAIFSHGDLGAASLDVLPEAIERAKLAALDAAKRAGRAVQAVGLL